LRADVDPAVEAAFDETVGILERDLGLPVARVDRISDKDDVPFSWFVAGGAELAESLAEHRDRWDEFEPGLVAMLQIGEQMSLPDYLGAQRARYVMSAAIEDLLADGAVLVTPTLNVTSWAPSGPLPDGAGTVSNDPSIAVNTMDFNYTGHPAVSVPMGIGPEGVPMGLQVVAPRFEDRLALGLAAALEQARPWPATAPGYEPFAVS
jgi:Asp-tRNA(Asn)/Glu-tRNA(Gln) amidotransferase A subunit family amidase